MFLLLGAEAFLRFSTLISALNPSTDGVTPDGDVEHYVLGFKAGRNYHYFPLFAIVYIEGGKE